MVSYDNRGLITKIEGFKGNQKLHESIAIYTVNRGVPQLQHVEGYYAPEILNQSAGSANYVNTATGQLESPRVPTRQVVYNAVDCTNWVTIYQPPQGTRFRLFGGNISGWASGACFAFRDVAWAATTGTLNAQNMAVNPVFNPAGQPKQYSVWQNVVEDAQTVGIVACASSIEVCTQWIIPGGGYLSHNIDSGLLCKSIAGNKYLTGVLYFAEESPGVAGGRSDSGTV